MPWCCESAAARLLGLTKAVGAVGYRHPLESKS